MESRQTQDMTNRTIAQPRKLLTNYESKQLNATLFAYRRFLQAGVVPALELFTLAHPILRVRMSRPEIQ
ncbi:MAG: hypothetical protein CMM06_04265 [Rhodopirellula sp.]|nr:hypothetical protein [Planctomycetaceae bacterium]MBL98889.1 hypothetical protein [Rhodopirellula sp.]|tara:strand:- start:93833 stop:94039 length:207 start_codon:yes stop_codon:yes gene_type:complete